MQNKKITICACASRSFMDKRKVAEIAAAMKNEGYSVTILADLCRNIMNVSPDLQEIASGIVMACYLRAVRSHFQWRGLEADNIIDIRNSTTEEILDQFITLPLNIEDIPGKDIYLKKMASFPVENGTDAWYPIIDKTRCKECGKCHDFCLFGVYAVENRQVKVAQPQNCKNNCPACARMCPAKAIIFPKYEKSPINGGIDEEEKYSPEEMDKMYRDKLRMKLQQRRASVSLLKNDNR